jgi:hypothetical protein
MRLSDVVVGQEYEYKKYSSSRTGCKAVVLEVGVALERYTYPGVMVKAYCEKVIVMSVPAFRLRRPWEEAKADYREQDALKKLQEQNKEILRELKNKIEPLFAHCLPNSEMKLSMWDEGSIHIKITDQSDARMMLRLLEGELPF